MAAGIPSGLAGRPRHLHSARREAGRGAPGPQGHWRPAGVLRRSCKGPAPPLALTLRAADSCKSSCALIGPTCQKRWRQPPASRAPLPSAVRPALWPGSSCHSDPQLTPSFPCPSPPPKSSQWARPPSIRKVHPGRLVPGRTGGGGSSSEPRWSLTLEVSTQILWEKSLTWSSARGTGKRAKLAPSSQRALSLACGFQTASRPK